jgi:hypothetical protein
VSEPVGDYVHARADQEVRLKPYKSANPLIWGAVLAIIVGIGAAFGEYMGAAKPDNPLIETPLKAASASFAFGYIAALFRNWFNERHHGP